MYVLLKALLPVCMKYTGRVLYLSQDSHQELAVYLHTNEVAVFQVFCCILQVL